MVQNYELGNILSFVENIDLTIAEGWMILMKHPCVVDVMPQYEERLIFAQLELDDPPKYQMKLWMPQSLAEHVCCQFYGEEESLDLQMIAESIGELLNIIAGNLLGIISSPAKLSIPDVNMNCSYISGVDGIIRTYSTPKGSFTFGIERKKS